jgi:hypothetical protein
VDQRIALGCTVWGLKQIDLASNSINIANVKPRDFEPCAPFIIKGRPIPGSDRLFRDDASARIRGISASRADVTGFPQ